MASGHLTAPHQQAGHMAAPTSSASPSKKPLPTGSRPHMAKSRLPGHVAGTSALPLTTDIRAPKSAFAPISSASPPGADLPGGVAEGPFLTLSGHRDLPRRCTTVIVVRTPLVLPSSVTGGSHLGNLGLNNTTRGSRRQTREKVLSSKKASVICNNADDCSSNVNAEHHHDCSGKTTSHPYHSYRARRPHR